MFRFGKKYERMVDDIGTHTITFEERNDRIYVYIDVKDSSERYEFGMWFSFKTNREFALVVNYYKFSLREKLMKRNLTELQRYDILVDGFWDSGFTI